MSDLLSPEKIAYVRNKTNQAKKQCLDLCVNAGGGHVTSAFSCAEIMAVLYYSVMIYDKQNPDWEERDRLILSKNHGSVITYPMMADIGFVNKEDIYTFMQNGSIFGAHSKMQITGVDFSGGSLGIGLGVAAGMAYAAKMDQKKYLVFCLVGDGECYEGSIWEAAMFAGHHELSNLIVIVDRNQISLLDFTENTLRLESFADKWAAFGFEVRNADGHNISDLMNMLCDIRDRKQSKPLCIIANTVKGKGIDFMVNNPFAHGEAPKGEKIQQAYDSLNKDMEEEGNER